jgi:hypothetical protein
MIFIVIYTLISKALKTKIIEPVIALIDAAEVFWEFLYWLTSYFLIVFYVNIL